MRRSCSGRHGRIVAPPGTGQCRCVHSALRRASSASSFFTSPVPDCHLTMNSPGLGRLTLTDRAGGGRASAPCAVTSGCRALSVAEQHRACVSTQNALRNGHHFYLRGMRREDLRRRRAESAIPGVVPIADLAWCEAWRRPGTCRYGCSWCSNRVARTCRSSSRPCAVARSARSETRRSGPNRALCR